MSAPVIFKTLISAIANSGRGAVRDKHKVVVNGTWRYLFTTTKAASKDTTDVSENQTSPGLRDPFPVFLDQKVQELLYRMTGFDALKIAGPQKVPLDQPTYKLLTDEQLAQELQAAKERLKHKLQIPPYMNARKDHLTPLAVDPDLASFDTSSYIFTDISYGLTDRERNVVIRETDGTLKIAPWSVKERMNHIYNPREGREYFKPKMFEEHNLERMISEKRYIYILDRACCQFEPDDVDYVRTTHRVFSALNDTKEFHILRSTRHFGSLVFYLVWNKMIDYLLLDMLNRDLVSDSRDLVRLFCIIHPESQCSIAVRQLTETDHVSLVKAYIETESKQKSYLELALQAMEDARKSRQKTEGRSTS